MMKDLTGFKNLSGLLSSQW